MCCPSASCMLHAGSVACHTHFGQLPCQPSQHGKPANIETTGYTTSTAGSRYLLQPCSFCQEAHIIAGMQQRLGARHSQPRHRDKLHPCGLVACRWAHAAPQETARCMLQAWLATHLESCGVPGPGRVACVQRIRAGHSLQNWARSFQRQSETLLIP